VPYRILDRLATPLGTPPPQSLAVTNRQDADGLSAPYRSLSPGFFSDRTQNRQGLLQSSPLSWVRENLSVAAVIQAAQLGLGQCGRHARGARLDCDPLVRTTLLTELDPKRRETAGSRADNDATELYGAGSIRPVDADPKKALHAQLERIRGYAMKEVTRAEWMLRSDLEAYGIQIEEGSPEVRMVPPWHGAATKAVANLANTVWARSESWASLSLLDYMSPQFLDRWLGRAHQPPLTNEAIGKIRANGAHLVLVCSLWAIAEINAGNLGRKPGTSLAATQSNHQIPDARDIRGTRMPNQFLTGPYDQVWRPDPEFPTILEIDWYVSRLHAALTKQPLTSLPPDLRSWVLLAMNVD
jgi:hypothetical protein